MKVPARAVVALLIAAAAVAATMALGFWQMRRGDAKEALRERVERAATEAPRAPTEAEWSDPAALVDRHLRLTGEWLPDAVAYLDNRPHGDASGRVTGVYVLMGLRIDGSAARTVVVNRGWLPHDPADRARIAPYRTPAGRVTVEGIAASGEPRLLELGHAKAPTMKGFWQNFDAAAFARASGQAIVPLVVREDARSAAADGLDRDWPERGAALEGQIARHRGYAFQWFALAATLVVLVVVQVVRARRASS